MQPQGIKCCQNRLLATNEVEFDKKHDEKEEQEGIYFVEEMQYPHPVPLQQTSGSRAPTKFVQYQYFNLCFLGSYALCVFMYIHQLFYPQSTPPFIHSSELATTAVLHTVE